MEQSSTHTITCPNCSVRYSSSNNYCGQCGQTTHLHDESFVGMIGHFIGHYFHYESKFWSTIRQLVTHPGALTIAYKSKQRMRYVPPVSLFIFITIATFILTAFLEYLYISMGWDTGFSKQDIVINGSVGWDDVVAGFDNAYVLDKLELYGPKIFFVLAPFFGLLLKVFLFTKKDFLLSHHIVFSMHFHCFFFVVMLLCDLIPDNSALSDYALTAGFAACGIYLILALKNVYRLKALPALLIGSVISFVYFLLFLAAFMFAVYLVLLQYAK
ncbi:MAG TPA: DUF3667 domain-containing protein [Flavipsychrobacter sp.]|nr:DUF3667 domain-containing protein [Flavipsychrobacter sp.]